jgi:hypothetical protein
VLERLGLDVPGFPDGVRLITGASGGMVGAAYYLKSREEAVRGVPGTSRWVTVMPTNPLPAIASHIGLVGVAQSLLPRLPHPLDLDRGQVLEHQFTGLERPFRDFRDLEGDGAIPSLVFSPVTVDDGRRLIISNLSLERLAVSSGGEIGSNGNSASVYSVAAPEFYRIFGAGGDGLTLATAARMSASFPMVSPAVNLPTEPPIRVVDAGYYDNYGVNLAVAWIFKNHPWLVGHTSGVALIQIRAFTGRRGRLGPAPSTGDSIANGVQFFSTPIEAFAGARETTPMFRNDEEVAALGEILALKGPRPDFFTTIIFENSAQVLLDKEENAVEGWPAENRLVEGRNPPQVTDVAMTWFLSQVEKRSMDRAIPSEGLAKHRRLSTGPTIVSTDDQDISLLCRHSDRVKWISKIRDWARELPDDQAHEAQRMYYVKEFERALNFERIRAFKSWWEN